MIDWSKYIEVGDFISTHGIELPFKWEFSRIENYPEDIEYIISGIIISSFEYDLVAIHTVHPEKAKKFVKAVYYPKTNILDKGYLKKGEEIGKYVIYDDVVTTGKSMLKCIEKIGYEPEYCVCIKDRREEAQYYLSEPLEGKKLKIMSLYKILSRVESKLGKEENARLYSM